MTDTDMNFNSNLFNRVEKKKAILDGMRPLPAHVVTKISEDMRIRHTYNSNALEGNTLTLNETKMIIEEGITVGGKALNEHLEATGNSDAYLLVERFAKDATAIDHVVIQQLHQLVTRGQQIDSGQYRTWNVRISGAEKQPPDFSKVVKLMDKYIVEIGKKESNPLLMGAYVHHRFVEIHPFSDGNGRVARLLLNLFLIVSGYLPIILKKEDRLRYYSCLRKADKGNLGPLTDFILHEEDSSFSVYLSTFGADYELIPLKEIAKDCPYSQEYLSLRARQGVLDAVKIGKVWHSTKKSLKEYVDNLKR